MTISAFPPADAVTAINSGSTNVLRRVEIYENDGKTLWLPSDPSYLKEGSVSVDYSRDERRVLDSLVLNSQDNMLRSDPYGGLWYDKVIKVYRGVRYPLKSKMPSIVIVASADQNSAYELRAAFSSMGFSTIDVKLGTTDMADVETYDMVLVDGRVMPVSNIAFVQQLFDAGRNIFTIGKDMTSAEVPFLVTVAATGSPTWGIDPMGADTPLEGTFAHESYAAATGQWVTGGGAGAIPVARWSPAGDGTYYVTAMIKENESDGRWFHFHASEYGTQAKALWRAAALWLYRWVSTKDWETQIGEFCIDKIDEANFPYTVSISGRDYTKKCLLSKTEMSMSFPPGTKLYDLIIALGSNAGITKFKIPKTTEALRASLDIERGTDRWSVMKQAANSLSYELFFDGFGYLVMRKFIDPTTGPIATTFQTGPETGNLVDLSRSVNDSRLYNHIIVTGENEAQDGETVSLNYFGEAKNTDPNSPTNIDRLGDRSYFYTSTFFTSNQQCVNYANSLLKIHALESFEMNWSSLNYIWLDVGEVIELLDPDRLETDPTRYLMDTMSISLGLDPMSATGKRVTYAGSAQGPAETLANTDEESAA